MRKSILLFFLLLLLGTIIFSNLASAATYNYGEALQKSIYFYECQQSGALPSWNRARQWRGDSCLNDYVTGGWYDGADHVKFGLPMAYTASMLGWALYEYCDTFTAAGQKNILENNLKFTLDYLVRCDKGTGLVYQIGDGGTDHSLWVSAEMMEKALSTLKPPATRPYYICNASCVTAQTAAALAIGAKVFEDSTYLSHAVSLFNLADSVRSDASYTAANGYYNSWSGFWDDLMWAAIWLYYATGDPAYLAKAESYIPNLPKEAGSDTEISYKWGHNWDDCHYGAYILLARLTGKPEYYQFIERHLDWWVNGANKLIENKLAYLRNFDPLMHASTEAYLAFIYSGMIADPVKKAKYENFAMAQINYILGDNQWGQSFLVGFGSKSPQHPHHRDSHGSYADNQSIPAYNRHILYGALVGGPVLDTYNNPAYIDNISDYACNNVSISFNAGLVGALTAMYNKFGGTTLPNFPATETVEPEFFVEASIKTPTATENPSYTEVTAWLNNRSSWPPRILNDLSFNYYMDLSELFASGYSESDVTVEVLDQYIPFTISPLTRFGSGGYIYYVKVTPVDSTLIWPGGSNSSIAYRRKIVFKLTGPTRIWDPINDPSNNGLDGTLRVASNIPCYSGSTRLSGTEPRVYYTPEVGSGLRAEYSGTSGGQSKSVIQIDPTVNFNWGTGSPVPGMDPDYFQVRWLGWIMPPATGTYTFYTISDDRIWLQINYASVISNWVDHGPTEDSGSVYLKAGVKYPIYVTSTEATGGATTVLMWSGPGIAKSVVGSQYLFPQGIGLKGEYYDNMDLTNLKLTRTDPGVGFDWGVGSPDPAVGPDTFSVRWTGSIRAPYSGYYTFYTNSDDGVRAWIGGQILTWNWTDHGPTENSSVPIWLPAGSVYTIKMEYYENGGGALAQLKWSSPTFSKQIIPEFYLLPQ